MVQIADKSFTQQTNLNVIDELRVGETLVSSSDYAIPYGIVHNDQTGKTVTMTTGALVELVDVFEILSESSNFTLDTTKLTFNAPDENTTGLFFVSLSGNVKAVTSDTPIFLCIGKNGALIHNAVGNVTALSSGPTQISWNATAVLSDGDYIGLLGSVTTGQDIEFTRLVCSVHLIGYTQ